MVCYTNIVQRDRRKQKMNQREWQAWAHIRYRALECMWDYDDYPHIQDKLNEDLEIIQDLLTKAEGEGEK